MAARSGSEFLERLSAARVHVEIQGETLTGGEADAAPNEFGVLTPAWAPLNTARNLYPKLYQRFPEILRKLGASGLMATPPPPTSPAPPRPTSRPTCSPPRWAGPSG